MGFPHRVAPDGSLFEAGARGGLTGNRGILHGRTGQPWRHRAWISCTLNERSPGQRLPLTARGHYTPLFFLDEAVALSAGHRPCALCRRDAFRAFQALWARHISPEARAPEIDRCLHRARCQSERAFAPCAQLPDHCFILWQDRPARLSGPVLIPWAPGGYGAPRPRPQAEVKVLTPAPIVTLLAAGNAPAMTRGSERPSWPDARVR